MENTDRELTHYEIIKLVKNVNFDPNRLNVYSIDALESWKRTMSMIPYDLQNGDMEIKLTKTTLSQAIVLKRNPWGIDEEPAEDVKGKLLKIDNGNSGLKNHKGLTKRDIDRMYLAAKDMIDRDAVVVNGKVSLSTNKTISREEHVYRCTIIHEIKDMLMGTKMVDAPFWTTNNIDDVIELIMLRNRDRGTQNYALANELSKNEPDQKNLSKILKRIDNIDRHILALNRFIELRKHIEKYDSERFQVAN